MRDRLVPFLLITGLIGADVLLMWRWAWWGVDTSVATMVLLLWEIFANFRPPTSDRRDREPCPDRAE